MKKIIFGFALSLLGAASHAANMDIVDTAVSAGKFNTLVAAVSAASLVDTLKSPGPFTVFAPTDDAFAALPPGTVEALLKDIPALTNILLYHVVADSLDEVTLVNSGTIKTVQGQDVVIMKKDGQLYLNGSKVLVSEIKASNGVIYVIDAVLLPSAN